jgi:hypothetical protein
MVNCPYCESELMLDGDMDENGNPFCECDGAELERAQDRIIELEAARRELREHVRWLLDHSTGYTSAIEIDLNEVYRLQLQFDGETWWDKARELVPDESGKENA